MRAVIDTNCLLASIYPSSTHYWLYVAFKAERFDWIVSSEILLEYEEKLQERYSVQTGRLVLNILSVSPNVIYSEPYFKWNLVESDADDNKFADLAIAANADYLVTNDKDFNSLKTLEFPKLSIVNIEEFRKIVLP